MIRVIVDKGSDFVGGEWGERPGGEREIGGR